jgi:hypothetical protein
MWRGILSPVGGYQEVSMKAGFSLVKARTALMLWAALAVAGAAPVLGFVALVGWQIAMLFLSGKWTPLPASVVFPQDLLSAEAMSILSRVHVGVMPALLGLGVGAFGVLGVLRQRAAIRAHHQEQEDRLRRVTDYRREGSDFIDGRREPYISDRRAA